MPHIVDQLIEERATGLRRRPVLWRAVRRFLYPILNYRQAIAIIDALQPLTGAEAFEWLSNRLHMRVEVEGLEHLPETGRVVVVANHPAGIADGVAMWDALKCRRKDMTFFANRDAIRAVPRLADIIIPVEWLEERRTRERSKETVRHMVKAFRDERVIVIFPSGRLAKPTTSGLIERPWMPTAISLAQKYDCPIVPIHVSGRSSWLYYVFYFLSSELRDMTLFRELLNKSGQRYGLKVGLPFKAVGDAQSLTEQIRAFVAERMPRGDVRFLPEHSEPSVAPGTDNGADSCRATNGVER